MASTTVAPEIFDKLFTEELQRYELVNGELRAKPMVSIFHGLLMAWLSHLLHLRLTELGKSEELWVLADPLAKIREDHWRRPDIAVIKAEDADPWKYVMPGHWPVLCIEIVSPPDQSVDDMLEKCKLYHDQGVQHCWVLEPESRAAWSFDAANSAPRWIPSQELLAADSIGIAFKPEELWRGLHHKRGKRLDT
jgi:Uma2 family endonuclease